MARILVVEDHPFFLEQIVNCLTLLGHEVVGVKPKKGETYIMATSRMMNEIYSGRQEFNIVLMDHGLGDDYTTGDRFVESFLSRAYTVRQEGLKVISISSGRDFDKCLYDGELPNKIDIERFKRDFQKLYRELFPQTEGENMSGKHV